MVGVANATRQATLTQCGYDPRAAAIPAVAALPGTPVPSALVPSAPDGHHFYELAGNACFFELATGKSLDLGPVKKSSTFCPTIDLDATSFVTPSAKKKGERSIKKEKASVVKKETVTTRNMGGDDNDDDEVVYVSHRMTKKRRVDDVHDVDDVEVVEKVAEILENVLSQELPQTCDLPLTCDFTKDPSEDEDEDEDKSDGDDTVASKDLLAESS